MQFDINKFNSTEQCQCFVDLNITNARYERAKAVGYAALTVITAVAISAITYYSCVILRMAYIINFSDMGMFYWMADFELAHTLFAPSGVVNGLVCFFPIKILAESIFKNAQSHWARSNELYEQVALASDRKISLA